MIIIKNHFLLRAGGALITGLAGIKGNTAGGLTAGLTTPPKFAHIP